jgi:hypothetical protein
MDHLYIPEACKPHAAEVPFLGVAPPYDGLGFDGFLERNGGLTADRLLTSSNMSAEKLESYLQEWLWFGTLDEFSKACGIVIDRKDCIKDGPCGEGKVLTLEKFYDVYVRRIVIQHLDSLALAGGLKRGDLVRFPHDPSTPVYKQLHPLVVAASASKKRKRADSSSGGTSTESQTNASCVVRSEDEQLAGDCDDIALPLDVLIERIWCWENAMVGGKRPYSKLGSRRRPLAKAMRCARKMVQSVMKFEEEDDRIRLEVVLAIEVLCFTLDTVIRTVYRERMPLVSEHLPEGIGLCDALEDTMFERNWCSSRARLLVSSGTVDSYVASLLPSYEEEPHPDCRPEKCVKLPASTAAMPVKHKDHCKQDCPVAIVKEADLIAVWVNGGIPGVCISDNSRPDRVSVVNCVNRPFVAVSHVWAHGLGNAVKTELPSCQVGFLWELVQQICGEDGVLWIDTLVVPIEPGAKRAAISQLRRVYSQATTVLVIDKHLLQVGPDPIEQLMQLLASEWMRRLWTLQEGRLAKCLLVQFKHGPVPVSKLMRHGRPSDVRVCDLFRRFSMELENRFNSLEALPPAKRFALLIEDLGPRRVTYPSDEPICLATLLGLSLEHFDPYPTMADIYRTLRDLPADLLFLQTPLLLEEPGLTWAPASFLESVTGSWPGTGPLEVGRLTADGFLVTKDCLRLHRPLEHQGSEPYDVHIITLADGQRYGIQAAGCDIERINERTRTIERPVVLWHEPLDEFAVEGSVGPDSEAVLVNVTDERDGVIYCRFEMPLEGWHIRDEFKEFHESMLVDDPRPVIRQMAGDATKRQRFCVA